MTTTFTRTQIAVKMLELTVCLSLSLPLSGCFNTLIIHLKWYQKALNFLFLFIVIAIVNAVVVVVIVVHFKYGKT